MATSELPSRRPQADPKVAPAVVMVRPERFELPTYCSGGNRSIQLSYGRASSGYYSAPLHLSMEANLHPLGEDRSAQRRIPSNTLRK